MDNNGRANLPMGMAATDDPADEPLTAGTPRPALTSISVHRVGQHVTASTTLSLNGKTLTGQATSAEGNRDRAIAQATLDAVQEFLPNPGTIESAQMVTVPGRTVAVAVIECPDDSDHHQTLVGSALVHGDAEDALARAVLSALNRRLTAEAAVTR